MRITRIELSFIAICLLLVMFSAMPASSDQLFAPKILWDRGIAQKSTPVSLVDTYLGIPYRDDGTLDENGFFTIFENPTHFFDTPGLNCSGLVLSASRFLFNKNWTLAEATRDRLGDSGEGAPLGKDWDFGLDLILNIADEFSPRVVMPGKSTVAISNVNGLTDRGIDLHDAGAWRNVMSLMKPGHAYLGSISKPGTSKGYKLMHYHVVLILPDPNGDIWLYHSTRRSQVHKMNINSQQGLSRLMSQFRNSRGESKKILLIEAKLPAGQTTPRTESEAKEGHAQDQAQRHTESDRTMTTVKDQTSEHAQANGEQPAPQTIASKEPEIVINHLSGRVITRFTELTTAVPKITGGNDPKLKLSFTNRGNTPRELTVGLLGPDGKSEYTGVLPENKIINIYYPDNFGVSKPEITKGRYTTDIRIDGKQWTSDLFDVSLPREASPRIAAVKTPTVVQSGKTFEVRIEAVNEGAESDYGGITVSSPDPSGLKIVGAKPGKVYGAGSTVLAVTSDRIRTKVPMAERWIELWGENKSYDMTVKIQAGRPGDYSLYVRCALRGVNVKSNVIRMDPQKSEAVDQQGFPVNVYRISVK